MEPYIYIYIYNSNIYAYISFIYIYIYIYIYVYIYNYLCRFLYSIFSQFFQVLLHFLCIYISSFTYMCTLMYMYIHTHIYIYIYIYSYLRKSRNYRTVFFSSIFYCLISLQINGRITEHGIFLEQLETNPHKYLPEISPADLGGDVVQVSSFMLLQFGIIILHYNYGPLHTCKA